MKLALVAGYMTVLTLLALFNLYKIRLLIKYYRYRKKPILPKSTFADTDLPKVTVQLPVYNEKYVVGRLIDATCAIDYPRDKFEVQVLDDSTDETCDISRERAAYWREQGVDVTYIHRNDRTGFKAGALQNGMEVAKGDFLAIFDADFIPPKDYLTRTVHQFTDPEIGLVQARWGFVNRDHSLLTRIQSFFLNGHFVVEHTAKNRSGSFFNFNGTAGIWRKEAIFSAGGWSSDTITEDMDLSYRAQLNGWRFVYLPDLVVPSELPVTIDMLKNQQFRWTKGMTQCAKKLIPRILRSNITFSQKFDACMHLVSNSGYVNTSLLALFIVPTLIMFRVFFQSWPFYVVVAYFLTNVLSICIYYCITESEVGGFKWKYIPDVGMLLVIGIALSLNSTIAILEAIVGKPSEFVRTPKFMVEGEKEVKEVYTGYKIPWNRSVILEILFLTYFLGNVAWVAVTHHFHLIPVLALFLFSYSYTIWLFYRHVVVPGRTAAE